MGQYIDADLRCHGLLLSKSAFTTIDDPDALSHTGAGDINDRGQIVGFYDGGTGLAACFPRAVGDRLRPRFHRSVSCRRGTGGPERRGGVPSGREKRVG